MKCDCMNAWCPSCMGTDKEAPVPICPHSAEPDRTTSSEHCIAGACHYCLPSGTPACPHPKACDTVGHCTHPKDSHDDWKELNRAEGS